MRPVVVIPSTLLAFAALGAVFERWDWFEPIRSAMRDPTAPAGVVDVGELGRILTKLDVVTTTRPRVNWRWRGKGTRAVYTSYAGGSEPPASDVLARDHCVDGWPLISVAVDEADLHDPVRGIFANWKFGLERPAHVSYFEGRELRFSTRCGVRLHGGWSRRPEKREQHGANLRLYLREEYGATRFPDGLLFGPETEPVHRLVIRKRSALRMALAFDVARQLGATAPAMRPALHVFNGEFEGIASLGEHLTRRLWANRLAHTDFAFYRVRGANDPADEAAMDELWRWLVSLGEGEATMDAVRAVIDVDAFTRHLFGIMWCGTDDWAQGAAVLDRSEEAPRWRWIHWDMDRSFARRYTGDPRPAWEKPSIDLVLGEADRTGVPDSVQRERAMQRDSFRGMLFRKLLRDDPAYRALLVDLATRSMNHRLTTSFFEERLAFYGRFVGPGLVPEFEHREVAKFVRERSDVVRRQLAERLDLGEAFRCQIRGLAGEVLLVDGFEEGEVFDGVYFAGQEVQVALCDEAGSVAGWRVNGELRTGARVWVAVRGPTVIEACAEAPPSGRRP